ncbi:toll-like receptor 12 [Rhinophrynus dorsalis]
MPLHDSILGKRCALYKNATLLAICGNITDIEVDLTDVPTNTEILCLSGSNKVIKGGTFVKFYKLMYLIVKMPVSVIHPEAFKGLDNLEGLSISFLGHTKCNNLSLPENVLLNLSSLKILNLEGFHLTQSTLIRLPPFTVLHTLSLPTNCISDLFHVFHIFQNLISIHTLNVGSNKIHSIEDTLLQEKPNVLLPNITELNLSKNPLKKIQHNAFARFHMRLLNLDYTYFKLEDLLTSGIVTLEGLSLISSYGREVNKMHLLCSIAERLKLKSFLILDNRIAVIHTKEVQGCSSLEILNLNQNRLRSVDSDFLYTLPKLKILYLSYSMLNMILCPASYRDNFTSGLQVLHFANNNITIVKNRQFFCMIHLKQLQLSNNGIEQIEELAFWGLNELQTLDLTRNSLTTIESGSLSGLSNLKEFHMISNPLQSLGKYIFKEQTKLQIMSIASESVSYSFVVFPSLQKLDIKTSGKYLIIYINDSMVSSIHTLSVNGSSIQIDVKCGHTFFTTVRKLQICNNNALIACAHHGSPLQQFKNLENLQYHFNGKPLSTKLNFSNIPNLISLEVENLATALANPKSNPNDLFRKLYKLKILKLINSGFKYITNAPFKEMNSLRILIMQNDMILTVDPSLQSALSPVNYLYLFEVTFQCGCENAWFVSWALNNKYTFVSGICTKSCLQLNKNYNLLMFVEKNCNQSIEFVLFIWTFSFLSLFIILTLLYNIFNSNIIQLIYIFQIWLQKLRGKKGNDMKYDYDAFVSYCSMDQDWVIQYLIPNLEEKGSPSFKLCLHNRDFQVGKDILDNIMDSIYKSRKTICLISYNYLQSEWCSLEMRMATYRILEEKNDDLILIFLEKISRYHLSSYHRLARMVKKKTYIDWPKEESEQSAFWERLRITILETKTDIENT